MRSMNTATTTLCSSISSTIEAGGILTVYRVSHQQKIGRKWEQRENHYLTHAKAEAVLENLLALSKHKEGNVRNATMKVVIVYTHE